MDPSSRQISLVLRTFICNPDFPGPWQPGGTREEYGRLSECFLPMKVRHLQLGRTLCRWVFLRLMIQWFLTAFQAEEANPWRTEKSTARSYRDWSWEFVQEPKGAESSFCPTVARVHEAHSTFSVYLSLEPSISAALPVARYLSISHSYSTTETLTSEAPGNPWKCFPRVRHTVIIIGVTSTEHSEVTGAVTSITMACQVQVPSLCFRNP